MALTQDLQSHEQQQKQLGDDRTSLDRRQDLLLTAEIEARKRLAGERKDIQNELKNETIRREAAEKMAALLQRMYENDQASLND